MSYHFTLLRLKKNQERRLRSGHLWVYSNEVDTQATPLNGFEPGQPVIIQAHNGKDLGSGYINPHCLLCARLVSRDSNHPFSPSLLVHRLKVALALRQRLYPQPYYRLVHGESDGLPGLVVDRYDQILVAQITTAGMESIKDDILKALDKVIKSTAVLWRNDSPVRRLEGLESYVDSSGPVPETLELKEANLHFQIPLRSGQKTGWFFDQCDNRTRLLPYVRDLRVLDLFSYVGAWGINAAVHGAREVICVDTSQTALDYVSINAKLNHVSDRVQPLQGDAFDVLKSLRESGERFDVIIVDPPAFVKRKKDLKAATLAYRRLNQAAMSLLTRDGLLISCSCSYHFSRENLTQILLQSARHLDRSLQVLIQAGQGPDHPVHPAIPETDYLKTLFSRILPA